jgi:hypothetical protein
MVLHVGPGHQGGLAIVAGQQPEGHVKVFYPVGEVAIGEWKVVQIDLWSTWRGDFRLRSLALHAIGDGALFDQIRLGATQAALDALQQVSKRDES